MKNTHYSWLVCLAGTLLAVCTIGIHGNVFSVYLPYIEAMGFSGSQSSALISMRCIFTLAAMLLINQYYRLLSLRVGLAVSVMFSALGNLLFSFAETMPLFIMASAISGLSYGFGSMISLSLLMRKWFYQRQAFAISICAAGSGLSTICFPPLITGLIEHFGMAFAFRSETVFALLCAVLAWVVIRDNPKQLSLTAYGVKGSEPPKAASTSEAYNMSRPLFFSMIAAMLLLGGVTTAAIGHVSILFTTNGYSSALAAASVSIFGIALTLGKFAFGWISDQYGAQTAGFLSFVFLALGCAVCCLCSGKSTIPVYAGAILLGIGYPVASLGSSVWAADFSSNEKYAETLKWFQVTYQSGGILFSFVPGLLYDATGSYRSSFALFFLFTIIMLLIVQFVYRSKGHAMCRKGEC